MTEDREKIRLEDGRHAERVIKSLSDGSQIIETWVEPKRKLHLAQRQVIRSRPCVYERETEVLDEETGEILKKEVEDMGEPKVQVREQIVSSLSMPEEQDSGFVSREELREDIKSAMLVFAEKMRDKDVQNGEDEYEYEYEDEPVSMQSVVEERLEEKKPVSSLSYFLVALVAVEVSALAYILFVL
jgi:hypothetical protein